jgi:Tfp pilus assembly protein PilV
MITRARRRELASQDGFALMEVIIAAAVLVLVVIGVLAGLDSVTSTAGANKARTVAATLAEKDQERLRGMKTLDIDKMNLEPYDVPVGKVTYHVESEAAWVYDASGDEVSCGVAQGKASYMRITSTVTSPITGKAVKPVVISSIVAPQVGATAAGSLSVVVKGAAGQPIKDVTVTAPPSPNVETTNELGCAVFGQLTAGTYKVTLSKTGYVDKEGVANPTNDVSVSAGSMSTQEFAYDVGASITVDVKDKPATNADEPSATVLAANGELLAGLRTFALTGPVSGPNPAYPTDTAQGTYSGKSFLLTGLFPFTNGYTFYAGRCSGNDPTKKIANYFDTNPGRVTLSPGQAGGSVTVYEPATNIRFKFGSGNATNATVFAYPIGTGCDGNRIPMGKVLSTTGHVTYQGLPYGDYQICAEYQSGSTWYEGLLTSYTVKDQNGAPTETIVSINNSNERCGITAP